MYACLPLYTRGVFFAYFFKLLVFYSLGEESPKMFSILNCVTAKIVVTHVIGVRFILGCVRKKLRYWHNDKAESSPEQLNLSLILNMVLKVSLKK